MKENKIIKKVKRKLRKVEGQLMEEEMYELYLTSSNIPSDFCIVEIGSFQGKSTLLIAHGTKAGNKNKIYAIDPHLEFEGVNGGKFGPLDLKMKYRNIVKYYDEDNIFVVALKSNQISNWEAPIGMIFIDGDHSYQGVKYDFENYFPHVVKGGLILFHDTIMTEIDKFISELNSNEVKFIRKVGTIKVFEKL